MAIFDLYSKRQKRLRGEMPDVFTYDDIPEHFRVQVVHIITDCIGKDKQYSNLYNAQEMYGAIHDILCREYGLFVLNDVISLHQTTHERSYDDAIFQFFLDCKETDKVLDIIQTSFKAINCIVREESYQRSTKTKLKPDDAIEELNGRFKEHGIGYQFESNELIRVDSTYLHSEVTKPALKVLRGKIYKGANEEFLKAHEHYRHGRNKECLNECLKSFESVMKAICDKRKWAYSPTDTSQKLIDVCLKNDLIPNYMQAQFTSLRSLLESGVPTLRNKRGGHGQGTTPIQVDSTIASYALHFWIFDIRIYPRDPGIPKKINIF